MVTELDIGDSDNEEVKSEYLNKIELASSITYDSLEMPDEFCDGERNQS
jgi:hypothetical protein